ncbi:MAG: hypothetical protein K8H88_15785 [Sandaracinaceae bacterium]|nr:hypothetical protein [Sandaracinaceae bacterium]
MDKGEAEAVAWALGVDAATRPVLVTRETRAIRQALERGVRAADVFALACAAVEARWISSDQARDALTVWADQTKEICRPKDYEGFDATYAKRLSKIRGAFDLA